MEIEEFKGFKIFMRGLNHFNCPKLKLFGYSSVISLKRAITREVSKREKQGKK
jgi:hypothetical protein